MSADTIAQKRKRIWIVCQRQKNCHIDPTPIRASKNFTIDFSGSKVSKCSKRNPLEAEKKSTEVFECQGQTSSWKIFLDKDSERVFIWCHFWTAGSSSDQLGPTCFCHPWVHSDVAARQIFLPWDSSIVEIPPRGESLECLSHCPHCLLPVSFIWAGLFYSFLTVAC